MDTLFQDLRYAVRAWAKQPLLFAVVVGSLALGIGANTTLFSLVNTLVLRPLPAEQPERLVALYTSESDGRPFGSSSYPDYLDLRARTRTLTSLAAHTVAPMSLARTDRNDRVLGGMVSGNYFTTLGTRAMLGRTLQPSDEAPGAPLVAVLSHSAWTRRFGADPTIVDRAITLNGHALTVVGVMPPEFRGVFMGITPEVWAPIALQQITRPEDNDLEQRGARWLFTVGRLAPGETARRAQSEMQTLMNALAAEYPADSGRTVQVLPEADARVFPRFRGPVTAFLGLLMGVAALVLFVACANVAGLLLSRAVVRRREIGVRLAIGASRGRIVRQLLTESAVLALCGGAAGYLLAFWGTDMLLAFRPPLPVEVSLDLRPDGRVLAFTLLVSFVTSIVFGLAPALEATRVNVTPALADASPRSTRRSRLRSALVVAQMAVSLLLLIGAGLLLRGLSNARVIDPGFQVERALVLSFDPTLHGYDESKSREFYRQLLDRVRDVPGVRAAALDANLPLGLGGMRVGMRVEGHERPDGQATEIDADYVSPGYFRAMGIPLVIGRDFTAGDRQDAPRVAIVNEAFARRYWPGKDPIGRRLGDDENPPRVVGVARTSRYRTLTEQDRPFAYFSFDQNFSSNMTLVVRTAGEPRAALPAISSAVRSVDPTVPLFEVRTLEEHLGFTLVPARIASAVLGMLGLLALALATIGLYGVIAFSVTQRTREIGVRVALGARPSDVSRLVVGQGMRLALIGMGVGLALALFATRLVAGLLFGVSPLDPATYTALTLALALVALSACWIPARRAAGVDPMVALRHE